MKRRFFLLMLCLAVCIGSARAGELPQYAEFARTYGIVRYFSPNPYTQRWSESDWMKVWRCLPQGPNLNLWSRYSGRLPRPSSFRMRPLRRRRPQLWDPLRWLVWSGDG